MKKHAYTEISDYSNIEKFLKKHELTITAISGTPEDDAIHDALRAIAPSDMDPEAAPYILGPDHIHDQLGLASQNWHLGNIYAVSPELHRAWLQILAR